MRVHHFSAATLCPLGGRLVAGVGGLFSRATLVCHCLLIEGPDGLVLVDTGVGKDDIADPKTRLGGAFMQVATPRLDLAETAFEQVKRLGFSPSDVRHIVPTHLDLDHAGGLPDFPRARVHLHEREHAAAMARATKAEAERYKPAQWAHGPAWVTYSVAGERWNGFEAVRGVAGTRDEILLVPLFGHTRGHAGVAVRAANGWLLHAGDAYFFRDEVHPEHPRCTPGLALFQKLVAVDNAARLANRDRLQALARSAGGEVSMFCAHDPVELARFEDSSPAPRAAAARVSA